MREWEDGGEGRKLRGVRMREVENKEEGVGLEGRGVENEVEVEA